MIYIMLVKRDDEICAWCEASERNEPKYLRSFWCTMQSWVDGYMEKQREGGAWKN